ncbi:MAG TPA: proprotein convertase P-domain-containing protein [Candidatus Binatia bacterium]|nr:proprotein convertase P-domain-containing protein [Candidatus Binatia bacterium]
MLRSLLAVLFVLVSAPFARANEFTKIENPTIFLASFLPPAVSTIGVPDDFTIAEAMVFLNLRHEFFPDLRVELQSPKGTDVVLGPLPHGLDPATQLFEMTAPVALFGFNGEQSAGLWTLTVTDQVVSDGGFFNGWTLDLTPIPEPGTLLLLGTGLAMTGLLSLRRRHARGLHS